MEKNIQAIKYSKRINVSIIAGSDAHFPYEIGCVLNISINEINSEDDLRSMIIKNKFRIISRKKNFYNPLVKSMYNINKIIGYARLKRHSEIIVKSLNKIKRSNF